MLWIGCKHGKCEHGQKVKLALEFSVAPRTVSRVWDTILSVMEAHLTNNLMFPELEQFDSRMLPIRQFPDHVFDSLKKGVVGRKKTHDREVLAELALNVPVTERGTYRNLAAELKVSKNMVASLMKEGVILET